MIPIGHIPSLTHLCSCTAYSFSTVGLSLSLSLALSLTDYPRHPRHLFLHKYTEKGKNGRKQANPKIKTDGNGHTQKSKQTQTDGYPHQNGRQYLVCSPPSPTKINRSLSPPSLV